MVLRWLNCRQQGPRTQQIADPLTIEAEAERSMVAWFPSYRRVGRHVTSSKLVNSFRDRNKFSNAARGIFDDKFLFSAFFAAIGINTRFHAGPLQGDDALNSAGHRIAVSAVIPMLSSGRRFVKPRSGSGGRGAFMHYRGTMIEANGSIKATERVDLPGAVARSNSPLSRARARQKSRKSRYSACRALMRARAAQGDHPRRGGRRWFRVPMSDRLTLSRSRPDRMKANCFDRADGMGTAPPGEITPTGRRPVLASHDPPARRKSSWLRAPAVSESSAWWSARRPARRPVASRMRSRGPRPGAGQA